MFEESTAHIIGGGVGGTVAAIITSPFEVVKVRFQSSSGARLYTNNLHRNPVLDHAKMVTNPELPIWRRIVWLRTIQDIVKSEGWRALFKGLVPTLFGVLPSRATYFYSYHSGQDFFGQYMPSNSSGVFLCSAILGSLTASTITSPIWFIKTRLQLDSGTGSKSLTVINVIKSTLQKDGVSGFYRGISASYVGSLETAINYVFYENIKARFLWLYRDRQRSQREKEGKALLARVEYLRDKRQYIFNQELEYQRLKRRDELRTQWWRLWSPQTPMVVHSEAIAEIDRHLRPLEEQLQLFLHDSHNEQYADVANLRGSAGGSKLQGFSDMLIIGFASCFSKGIAITITYPHEVVRTRLREPSGNYKGFVNTLSRIYKEESYKGLYRGLSTHYIRQLPNSAIMMGTYEGVIFALQYWGLMRVNGTATPRANGKPQT